MIKDIRVKIGWEQDCEGKVIVQTNSLEEALRKTDVDMLSYTDKQGKIIRDVLMFTEHQEDNESTVENKYKN